MTIGYSILLIFVLLGLWIGDQFPFEGGFWKNFLICGGFVAGFRLLFGGWVSYSFKGLAWQVGMSTIGALIIMIWGMKTGESNAIHIWPIIIVLGLSISIGIWAYKFIDDVITGSIELSFDTDNIIDSLFSNGIKNTAKGVWGELVDFGMDQMYYSASRGIAAYSNTVFFLSLFVAFYYR